MKRIIQIIPHKDFTKQLKKQSSKIQGNVKTKFRIFMNNQYDPILNNHALIGRWRGYRSINITGDTRAIYKQISHNLVVFVVLGTHSQLYS